MHRAPGTGLDRRSIPVHKRTSAPPRRGRRSPFQVEERREPRSHRVIRRSALDTLAESSRSRGRTLLIVKAG